MTQRIEDYAIIGDLRTAAFIGTDGAIDWLSLPRFDSPAVFAALLGRPEHGQWNLAPVHHVRCSRRRYQTGTLILETDWTTGSGAVRVTDLMVPGSPRPTIVRIVDGLVGTVMMRTRIAPRMNYGKDLPALRSTDSHLVATAGADQLWYTSDVALGCVDGAWTGEFAIAAGERISFTLAHTPVGEIHGPTLDADSLLAVADAFWTDWVSRTTYRGPWEAEVNQSLVILKALTYAPTGSIVAAATTSLPEQVGGSRNWDYRYSWLRDATFVVQAFLATGHLDEAEAWRDWVVRTVMQDPTYLRIMYAVDGTTDLAEEALGWLPGHQGSTPVRIGNGAAPQLQNDVCGEVLDTFSALRAAGLPDAPCQEKIERALLDHIESHWRQPDHGIWEVRGPRRHFVHSKLLAWAGVDRAVRRLEEYGAEASDELGRVRALRRTVAREISERGYLPDRRAFTQAYGSPRLDAAALLMPRYGFLAWDDPRMVTTIDAIQRDLTDHGLLRRYVVHDECHNVDGVPGSEGAFLATSFWLADALHATGRTGEAIELFERLLSLRNDVGLLSEQYDPATGRQLGNTPQAFSHAGLITTAITLSAATRPTAASAHRIPTSEALTEVA